MRADILTVAREMMQAEGAGALSWNAIARRLGMKPPSLYVYFDDKMAIYDALFHLGWELYGEQMEQSFDDSALGWEALRRGMEAHFQFCIDNPDLFQIMFQRPIPGFVPSEESLALSFGQLERGRQLFAEMVAVEEIELGMPLERAFDLWIATLHGLTAQHLANEPHLPLGQGRFGGLIPAALEMYKSFWGNPEEPE